MKVVLAALLAAGALLTAACEPLPEGGDSGPRSSGKATSSSKTPYASIRITCTMTGAEPPGYRWEMTKTVANVKRDPVKTFGTLKANVQRYEPLQINYVTTLDFRIEPVRVMPHGFIKCQALHVGPGKTPPFPVVAADGPKLTTVRLHVAVQKK